MRLPQPADYNEAVQNPQLCFRDDGLRTGQVVVGPLGLPQPHAGNFADVYQVTAAGGGPGWAVKCFTRGVEGLHRHYQAVSEHLRRVKLPFLVDFEYLDEGIRVRGDWFPVLKMRWVEGFTLNNFVREQLDRPHLLERLAQMWVRLAGQLRRADIAHADLQHGNVLLVAADQAARLRLRLIDYDGMFIPALADVPSGEVGHPNYQHPQRLRAGAYDAEVDRFSHLVIYTALRALALSGRGLWERHDNGENLLFREQDFNVPAESTLLHELWGHAEEELRRLAGRLVLASQAPLDEVPLLEELVAGEQLPALTAAEQKQAAAALGAAPRKAKATIIAHARRAAAPATPEDSARPWWLQPAGAPLAAQAVEEPEALAAAELLATGSTESASPLPPPPDPTTPMLPALRTLEAAPGQPPVRVRQVRVFRRTYGNRPEEEHLGFAVGDLQRGRFAMADGVAGSPAAALWGDLLTDTFVHSRKPQPAPWSAWLPPLQLHWSAAVAEEAPLPADPRQEALAAFLGLVVHRAGWLDRRRWEAVAVGDACLFQVRRGVLHRSFPLTRPGDFQAAPVHLGARTSFEPLLRKQEVRAEGDWAAGDEFWVMNRALAKWFVRQVGEWQRPWEVMGTWIDRHGAGFATWVDERRAARELEGGDVTLMAVCL